MLRPTHGNRENALAWTHIRIHRKAASIEAAFLLV